MSKKIADYDYVVQFVMRDVNDFKRLWEDEDFRASVHPDHKNFADETKSGLAAPFLYWTVDVLTGEAYRLDTEHASLRRRDIARDG
jgi:hypothetical protein